ncbi:hypothetical protein HCQ94_02255 [Actinomyces sp. zg-332]|uniref:hypothetical protein n=1 Tax=Actinomyces sp. zg-332 TaxID=2708340 RepID=UPI00141E3677|nr:hypothetical protein [Actinomyces sp. zg-332]QPK94542.1 hypothetical protein HCQ94_02255 [Actinomyces sp. zg-332]
MKQYPLGNVEEGVGEIKAKLGRFNEISELMAAPKADFDTLKAKLRLTSNTSTN